MVAFICDACGNTVKKNQVEKHYTSQCRNCSVLSCIDCGVDFPGDSYIKHTSCITEAEKYQGHLYQAKDKENKGEAKQKEWLKQVHGASGDVQDPKLKGLLKKLSAYSNIPRKKKKFENFCKNSVNVYDTKTLDQLWDVFNASNQKESNSTATDLDKTTEAVVDNGNESEESSTSESSDDKMASVEILNKSDSDLNLNSLQITKKKKKKNKMPSDEKTVENRGSPGIPHISKTDDANVNELSNVETEKKVAINNGNEIVNNGLESLKKIKKKKSKKNRLLNGDIESNGEPDNIKFDTSNVDSSEDLPEARTTCDETSNENKKHFEQENSCDDKSKRKKKKRKQVITAENKIEDVSEIEVQSTQKCKKSKKKKRLSNGVHDDIDEANDIVVNGDKDTENKQQSKKQKKGRKHKLKEEAAETEVTQVKSKKKKKKEQGEDIEVDEKENHEEEEEDAAPQGKFNWHKAIKTIVKKSEDHEISVKKLRKKVLAAYQEHGIDHRAGTMDESRALFAKKLKTYPKVKILKDVVKLVK